MKEVWKLIEEDKLPPIYQVSNLGRVRSIDRIEKRVNQFGEYECKVKGKVLRPCINRDGYEMIRFQSEGKKVVRTVHRLVAKSFIPNPEGKPCVNHKDLNKRNNVVSNLEWCTYKENLEHASENGVLYSKRGEESNLTKYTEEQVRQVYALCKQGFSQSKAGRIIGMPRATVASIMQKVSWKDVTDSLDEYHD